MKKITLLFAIVLLTLSSAVFGRRIYIDVVNYQFMPATVNARMGDTVIWRWKSGSHTTTSTSVPAGAATWDKLIDASHKSFRYILKVAGTYKYKCKPHASGGMKGTINVSAALTANLSDFAVNSNSANAVLSWKTTSAEEVSYFSIQRSTNGSDFKEIAKVNRNAANLYSFKDNSTLREKYLYYQVEMVDVNGNRQLSPIQMFTNKGVLSARLITALSPNPIAKPGHLMLQFNANKDGAMLARLYNQGGLLIKEAKLSAVKGANNGHFHMGDLAPGTYYIVFTLGDVTEKHTVIMK